MHLAVEPFTHFWHQKNKMVMVKTLMLRLWNRESRNQWWCVMVATYLSYTVCAVDSCSFYFLLGLKNICHGHCVYPAGSLLAMLLLFSSLFFSLSPHSPVCLGGAYYGLVSSAHAPGLIIHLLLLIDPVFLPLLKAVAQRFSSLDCWAIWVCVSGIFLVLLLVFAYYFSDLVSPVHRFPGPVP